MTEYACDVLFVQRLTLPVFAVKHPCFLLLDDSGVLKGVDFFIKLWNFTGVTCQQCRVQQEEDNKAWELHQKLPQR